MSLAQLCLKSNFLVFLELAFFTGPDPLFQLAKLLEIVESFGEN